MGGSTVGQRRQWHPTPVFLLCIPLQRSCMENPPGGAWWAVVYEVAQSLTLLKRLSSSSSSSTVGLDGWMTSPTWWTWVWASSGSWWWTGKPGMLQSMGSQRAGYDSVTELNWTLWGISVRQDHIHQFMRRDFCCWQRKFSRFWRTRIFICYELFQFLYSVIFQIALSESLTS